MMMVHDIHVINTCLPALKHTPYLDTIGKTYACLLNLRDFIVYFMFKAVFRLDGCLMMFYREDEETYYQPHMNRPDYKKGFYYCSRCNISFKNKEICPYCGIKTRKESRKRGSNGDKPRVNLDYGDGE